MNEKLGKYETDLLRPWLQDFVATIGSEEASRLLQNVGELEPLPSNEIGTVPTSRNNNNNKTTMYLLSSSSSQATTNSVYKVGDLVEANYKGEGEWSLAEISNVFPDEYYNVIYFDDCTEEIAISGSRIRRFIET